MARLVCAFYCMLLPVSRAARGIEGLADMASNSTFEPVQTGREREVIFDEARLEEDKPHTFLYRRLHELVFESAGVGHDFARRYMSLGPGAR